MNLRSLFILSDLEYTCSSYWFSEINFQIVIVIVNYIGNVLHSLKISFLAINNVFASLIVAGALFHSFAPDTMKLLLDEDNMLVYLMSF